MFPLYKDYVWKNGKPLGICKGEAADELYRIVSDPYQKWITVEAYVRGSFDRIVYDSRFLDFRKLKPKDQLAWRKEVIDEKSAWIFNEDDRLILRECYGNDKVTLFSPYGTLVGVYHMPEGPEGTIILHDSNDRIVMRRVEKKWDMAPFAMPQLV